MPDIGGRKGNADRGCRQCRRHPHSIRLSVLIHPQGTAIERFLVGIVELKTALPRFIVCHSRNHNIDTNVSCVQLTVRALDRAHMQVSPQEVGVRNRYGNQISSVDRNSRALLGRVFSRAFLDPLPEADFPQREGLQRRRFPGIIGTNKHHCFAKFDFNIFKTLKVLDSQAGQHCRRYYRAAPRGRSAALARSVRRFLSGRFKLISGCNPF